MSQDFFQQSFVPAPSSTSSVGTQRRKPPPPPAPPLSTGSTSNAAHSNPPHSTTHARPFINVSSHVSSSSHLSGPPSSAAAAAASSKRPTGDYYPTTATLDSNSSKPTFYSYYNNASSNTTGTSANATTSTTNSTIATHYSSTTTTQNSSFKNNAAPLQMQVVDPNHLSQETDDWFIDEQQHPLSSMAQESANYTQEQSNTNTSTYYGYNPSTSSFSKKSESMEILNGPMTIHPHTNVLLEGTIGNATGSIHNTTTMFTSTSIDYNNDEPPLLEELGINLQHIKTKSLAVILPMKYAKLHIDKEIMEDADLAGPCVYGLLLATELLLAGKISFGVIYGFGLFSSIATTFVLNLMSPSDSISIWTSVSILGYSLLPVNVLAAINIFYRIKFMGTLGVVLASFTIGWCTVSSTRLIEKGCDMRDQRWLVGYPNALLYSAFVMLTIF